MVDEIFDRGYQAGRADLHAGIDRAIGSMARELSKGFAALNRIQWSAPWISGREAANKDVGCA